MMNSLLCPRLLSEEEVEKLELHLQTQLNGRVRDLRVEARANGLIIRGWAVTYYAKQLAQHIVMETTATPIAANEIKVA
jgi:hypothetical protein